jgi:hypothetical protein
MRSHVEEVVRERRAKMKGRFFIHDLPPYSLTPSDIDRDIDNYRKQGVNPGLVVVDYADIMNPDKSYKERRHEFTDIYVGLRGVAKKQDVGVWSASQSNRASFKKRIIRLDDVAEDWGPRLLTCGSNYNCGIVMPIVSGCSYLVWKWIHPLLREAWNDWHHDAAFFLDNTDG